MNLVVLLTVVLLTASKITRPVDKHPESKCFKKCFYFFLVLKKTLKDNKVEFDEKMSCYPADTWIIVEKINERWSILFPVLSAISYGMIIIILYTYSYGDHYFKRIPRNSAILIFCGIVTIISAGIQGVLSATYIPVLLAGYGIFVNVLGAIHYFKIPGAGERPLSHDHFGIPLILWGITIPLFGLAFIPFIMITTTTVLDLSYITSDYCTMSFQLQGIVQTAIYHFSLLRKTPVQDKQSGASWYFKMLAVLNISVLAFEVANIRYTQFHFVLYSLQIEYRLLFCLLFLEHSWEIDFGDMDIDAYHVEQNNHHIPILFNTCCHGIQNRNIISGLVLGFGMFILQLVNCLQYVSTSVGPWTNIFPVFTEWMLIIQGIVLFRQVSRKVNQYFF